MKRHETKQIIHTIEKSVKPMDGTIIPNITMENTTVNKHKI